ncbi:hypothetical protein VCHA38O206_90050 [Vibrio chagasii]|nr:hypothetical protein VCHA37P199_130169 [Vibrio chagasii]CAH7133251.1 hypothetical protein VCHA35P150_90170 [Vibrio chagasii]CAH7428275.1 hypothetical protein VCHA38O206_90050 [Vibrio chagasii]
MLPHVVVTIAGMQLPGLVPNCYVSAKHVPQFSRKRRDSAHSEGK